MTIYTVLYQDYDDAAQVVYSGTDKEAMIQVALGYNNEDCLTLYVGNEYGTSEAEIADHVPHYAERRQKRLLKMHAERYIRNLSRALRIAEQCFNSDETAELVYQRTRGCATVWLGVNGRVSLPSEYVKAAQILKEAGDYAKQQQGIIDTVSEPQP